MSGTQTTSRTGSSSGRKAPAPLDMKQSSSSTNPGSQPQSTKSPTPFLNIPTGDQSYKDEEEPNSYHEANTALDNIQVPEDLDVTPTPQAPRRKPAPKAAPHALSSLLPSQNEAIRTLTSILTSNPTGSQTNLPSDPSSDPPSGNTKAVSREDKIYAQVFGNTIVELVNSLVIDSPPMIGLVTVHKDPELPIYKFLLHSLVDSHKINDSITSTAPGLTRIWSWQAKSTMLSWKKALGNYHKASANEQMDWPDSNTMYPLPLDTYTRESTLEVRLEIK